MKTSVCPHCDLGMDETHIRITRTRVSDMLNNLLVSCPLDCQMMVRAENFNKHLKSHGVKNHLELLHVPIIRHSHDHSEKSLAGSFINRMMTESPGGYTACTYPWSGSSQHTENPAQLTHLLTLLK